MIPHLDSWEPASDVSRCFRCGSPMPATPRGHAYCGCPAEHDETPKEVEPREEFQPEGEGW